MDIFVVLLENDKIYFKINYFSATFQTQGFLVGFARVLVTCGCPLSIPRGLSPLASRLRGATESCAIYMADP